jgi:hypothetical protein
MWATSTDWAEEQSNEIIQWSHLDDHEISSF